MMNNMVKNSIIAAIVVVVVIAVVFSLLSIQKGGSFFLGKNIVVSIENTSDDIDISSGILIVHKSDYLGLNYLGKKVSKEFEMFAETGDPSLFAELLSQNPAIDLIKVTDGPITPGTKKSFNLKIKDRDSSISFFAMHLMSNDGVFWISRQKAFIGQSSTRKSRSQIFAQTIDAGTEENAPLGSGFSGGQPDLSRGEENIDNGISTDDVVFHHSQIISPILLFTIDREE